MRGVGSGAGVLRLAYRAVLGAGRLVDWGSVGKL